MGPFALALILPWAAGLLITPITIRIARRYGWLDYPHGRKQHKVPVPLLGGVALFASMAVGLAVAAMYSEPIGNLVFRTPQLLGLAALIAVIIALGVWDDFADLSPTFRLCVQVAMAVGAWAIGFRCGDIELPAGWIIQSGPALSLLVTVGWIVLLTNAFNFLDGIDGLASGLAIVPALSIFLLAIDHGANLPVTLALALAGGLASFLRFNLPPARIFLGDGGAYGIGFTLGVISLASANKSPTAVVLIAPLLILALPIVDALLAALRRIYAHVSKRSFRELHLLETMQAAFTGDRTHVHYLLLRCGMSVRQVLAVLYSIAAAVGVLGIWTRTTTSSIRWGIFLGLLVLGYLGIRALERRALRLERDREPADARALKGGTGV